MFRSHGFPRLHWSHHRLKSGSIGIIGPLNLVFFTLIIMIIIHAFIKRRNPTCRSKALNNDVAEVTCKAN